MRTGGFVARCGGLGICLAAACVSAQDVEVGIRDYRYEPAEARVPVGATVTWINREKRTSHSILFLGKDGFESERIFPGERWQRRFDAPGRYEYSCGPHPEMKGVVAVE